MSFRNPFRVKTAFVLLALLAGFAAPASAVVSEFSVLMNTDVSPVSGCDVTTVDGVFPGVEHILITTVDTTGASSAQVIRIERQVCVNPGTDTFGPRILVDETDRPVGVGLGVGGFNVVETYFPLSALPPGPPNGPGVVRLGVTSLNSTGGQDALLTVSPVGNQPIQLILAALSPTNVPTLSEWGLILLGLLLAMAALVILRRRSATALLAALVLFTGAGIAWAAASDLDGTTLAEWGSPIANDTAGDAPVGADIRAFFAMEDGPTNRVYFRLDVSLEFNTSAVATDDAATVTEDAAATAIDVLANDTDAEGDPFTITAVTQPANGTVVITGGGTGLTYEPNDDYCNNPPGTTLDTFTYTITGGDTATVTMTVTCVPDDPTAVNDAATVAEDAPATAVNVLANDTDPDGGPISITSVTQPANGTVVITGGGTGLTYQPNADYCNTPPGTTLDTFTYTLTPGGSTATVTMTVTCADDPPTAVNDSATVAEDSGANAINVLANDTDPDGGPISITSVTQPANGTVVITGGGTGLTYAPNADYCNNPPGTTLDTFTYTLTPGGSFATVTVTVTCADDNPTAVADSATVTEDSGANAIDVLANDTDPDGGPISIDSVTQPANGAVVITGGGTGLTYAPNADYCNNPPGTALDTFTYTLTPGGSFATVTVTVTCVDDGPTAVNDSATVAEDSGANTINVQANDTDPDGGTNTITSVTQPANGTVAITNGGADLTYTPNANYCNTPPGTTLDTFTYTLTPGGSIGMVTVTVTCVDDPPLAVADAATVDEDSGANTINVLANDTDIDAGPISVTTVTQPANGTVVITNGGADLTYTPNANYCNNPPGTTLDTFNYSLTPGGSTATVTVTVTCLNDGPVIDLDANDDKGTAGSDFAVTFTEGNPATLIEDPLDATVTDVDSATLASLTVTITNLFDTGFETLAADTTGTSITANYATVPGAPGTGTLTLTGPDTVANFQQVLRTITYVNTDTSPDATPRVIQFVANDGTTNGNTAVSTVTVVSVDTNPTAVADAATVNEDSGANVIDVLANDTDPDGGPISITSVTQPANGTVVITGGGTGLTYTPNANYCNSVSGVPDTFTYTLTPGGSSTTVTVTVTCVDDNPTAVNDSATVNEDSGANTINVLANDTDPDSGPISITSVTQPANGTVVITNGGADLTYTPNANYCNNPPGTALDTFTYTLTPGGSVATVTVTVTCIDDNPTAVNDAATVVEDSGANAINVLANDTDPDGGAISITSVTQPANGTVVITGGGTGLTYAPNANYCNNPPGTTLDTFTYTLTPGGSVATVTVTVTCVDDPPVAVNDAATVNEDSGANTINVQANDTDVDGGTNTITMVTQPSNGTVVITNGGADLTYTPNANYCNNPPGTTLETFTYTLTPGGSMATVTVTVTCINDAPVLGDPDGIIEYTTLGNTQLRVGETTPGASVLHIRDNQDLLEKSSPSDVDGPGPLQVVPFSGNTGNGDLVLNANGTFTYEPNPGFEGIDNISFQVTDNGAPAATVMGTLRITVSQMVWYVRDVVDGDNPAAGDTGRSTNAFEILGDVEPVVTDNDFIFVFEGNTGVTPLNGGIDIDNTGVKLHGHGIGLTVPGFGALIPAANRPRITNTGAAGGPEDNGVNVVATAASLAGVEIRGLNISGRDNGIDVTATGTNNAGVRISENTISSDPTNGSEGIDVNASSTGTVTLAVHDNSLTARGTAIDITRTSGTVVITAFDDNVVSGDSTGAGIIVTGPATFDATPGGGLDPVSGGVTVIGASGNAITGAGLTLGSVTGALDFTDLDVFAGGSGVVISGTGAFTGAAGTRVTVPNGVSIVQAGNGPGVDVSNATLDLRLSSLTVSASPTTGVSLVNVSDGTVAPTSAFFSAPSGSTIANVTGTDFNVDGGNATISYGGSINNAAGRSVAVQNRTGDSVTFTNTSTITDNGTGILVNANAAGAVTDFLGTLTMSTGANNAFAATSGGTLRVMGAANTIATTTGVALNVTNTTIGAGSGAPETGLRFRSISAGTGASGPANGIVLNNTGALGGLTVTGTGGAGSGGTIQRTTGDSISLTSTQSVSLASMNVQNSGESGILGTTVTGLTLSSCTFTNNGDDSADVGIKVNNLGGTSTFTNTSVTGSALANVFIDNTSSVLNSFTITGGSYSSLGTAFGGNSILLNIRGTATLTTGSITGVTLSNNKPARAITIQAQDTATISDFTVQTSTFTNNGVQASFEQSGSANLNFKLLNNPTMTMTLPAAGTSHAVNVASSSTSTGGTIQGRVQGNTIGNAGVASSGSPIGNGIRVFIQGRTVATLLIDGNVVRQVPQARGIDIQFLGPTVAGQPLTQSDITVTNNDVNPQDSTGFPAAAIYLAADSQGGSPVRMRSDVRLNTVPAGAAVDSLPTFIIVDEVAAAAEAQLVDTAPASASCTAQLTSTNTGSASAVAGCALIAGPINTPP